MEQIMKEVYDKVTMDDAVKDSIKRRLTRKHVTPMWTKAVACVAICMVTLLFIPSTRTMIANAANNIIGVFHTADGDEVTIKENANSTEESFSAMCGENQYVEVSENRIYITVDNKRVDITDSCSADSYYRYEVKSVYGYKNVILVGGSIDKVGYVELIFDKEGNYITNKMWVPTVNGTDVEPWVDNAMHAEGVPTGNSELDKELDE